MSNEFSAVINPLIFFDIFDYPLTLAEVWKYQYINSEPVKTYTTLSATALALEKLADIVEAKNGFYFLKNREDIINRRLRRYVLAEAKYKKALKYARIFKYLPFVKAIFVCNNLAYSNSTAESDIDLFIIGHKNRLWLARFWTLLILKLANVRPKPGGKKDTIDITFFLSQENLSLEKIEIGEDDVYLAYWLNQLKPIYDPENYLLKIWQANGWVRKKLPLAFVSSVHHKRYTKDNLVSRCFKFIIKIFFDWQIFEKAVEKIQRKIMPNQLKELANQDTRVVINHDCLKFHQTDKRSEYQEKFNSKFYEIFG